MTTNEIPTTLTKKEKQQLKSGNYFASIFLPYSHQGDDFNSALKWCDGDKLRALDYQAMILRGCAKKLLNIKKFIENSGQTFEISTDANVEYWDAIAIRGPVDLIEKMYELELVEIEFFDKSDE